MNLAFQLSYIAKIPEKAALIRQIAANGLNRFTAVNHRLVIEHIRLCFLCLVKRPIIDAICKPLYSCVLFPLGNVKQITSRRFLYLDPFWLRSQHGGVYNDWLWCGSRRAGLLIASILLSCGEFIRRDRRNLFRFWVPPTFSDAGFFLRDTTFSVCGFFQF
jgi:hypothetical protein